uniref:Uncharacterized protein n=1 Tax=Sphaerodactylus townsendi TaxID=933632 RepID=A0ACB8F7N0_9SAUR
MDNSSFKERRKRERERCISWRIQKQEAFIKNKTNPKSVVIDFYMPPRHENLKSSIWENGLERPAPVSRTHFRCLSIFSMLLLASAGLWSPAFMYVLSAIFSASFR